MRKKIILNKTTLNINFKLNMNIEILSSNCQENYIEFDSMQEDVIIENGDDFLNITTPSNHKKFKNIYDIFCFFSKELIEKTSYEGSAKIYLTNQCTLELQSNKAKCFIHTSIKQLNIKLNDGVIFIYDMVDTLEIKINTGSITLSNTINNCKIKGNTLIFQNTSDIQNLDLKANNGALKLFSSNKVKKWDIKSHKASIVLDKNNFTGPINSKKSSENYSDNGQISIKSNSGHVTIL